MERQVPHMRPISPAHTQALMELLNRAPYFALLGMEFQVMEPGYCRLIVPVDYRRHGNAFGGVHGGVYSSLIDTVAYWALYCQMAEDQGYTSLDLNVTNLGMVSSGTLIAEGHVVRAGRSICLSEATVKDQTGKLLAHGTSKLMVLEGKQSIQALLAAEQAEALPPKFF